MTTKTKSWNFDSLWSNVEKLKKYIEINDAVILRIDEKIKNSLFIIHNITIREF